jgi:hypothetical protein
MYIIAYNTKSRTRIVKLQMYIHSYQHTYIHSYIHTLITRERKTKRVLFKFMFCINCQTVQIKALFCYHCPFFLLADFFLQHFCETCEILLSGQKHLFAHKNAILYFMFFSPNLALNIQLWLLNFSPF